MKRLLTLVIFVFVFATTKAQQKIKVDALLLDQLQIPINVNDTIWRSFKMPDSQFRGLQVLVAVNDAKFYSKEEVKQITSGLDKILNPDKFFTTPKEYEVCYNEFSKKWNGLKSMEKQ